MKKFLKLNLLLLLITAVILSGCGGGGGKKDDDDDKNGGSTSWTRLLCPASGEVYGSDIATDGENIYVTGYTDGNLDGQNLTGVQDLFVAKYNKNGVKLWTRLYGEAGNRVSGSRVIVVGGEIFVAGTSEGVGINYLIFAKYNSSGIRQWIKQLDAGSTEINVNGITSEGTYIYITGDTTDILDGHKTIGSQDFFIVKYDRTGNKQFVNLYGETVTDFTGDGITTDGSNLYVFGLIGDGNELFVKKFDSSGANSWTESLSGDSIKCGSITSDGTNIYVTGKADALGGKPGSGGQDLFVVKYDNAGVLKWQILAGVAGEKTSGQDIITNGMDIYVTGYTGGSLYGQSVTGVSDAFVIKYDTSGNKQWIKLLGTASKLTSGDGIAIIGTNTYVTGSTSGNLDGQTITGENAAFVTSKFGF